MNIFSFGVFDTLITSRLACRESLFAIMQDKLADESKYGFVPEYIRNNFYFLRTGAERQARGVYLASEWEAVSLEDIYQFFRQVADIGDEVISLLRDMEIETALDCMEPVSDTINELLALQEDKRNKVFMIADSCLGKRDIYRLLEKADVRLLDVPLYVSSEKGKTKRSGSLYEYIYLSEGLTDKDVWTHAGSDPLADKLVPEGYGIHTCPIKEKYLLPVETHALEKFPAAAWVHRMIGFSSNARFFHDMAGEGKKNLPYNLGSSFAFIIGVPYIIWLLKTACAKDIRRLYFIARDGYLLKKIADILIAEWKLGIQTHYLYGSRKAWRIPAAELLLQLPPQDMFIVVSDGKRLEDFAQAIGLSPQELESFLPDGFDARAYKNVEEFKKGIVEALKGNKAFPAFLQEKNKTLRTAAVRYLEQNIDCSDGKFAFVELTGSGTTQIMLSSLLKEFTNHPIRTFFFHMDLWRQIDDCSFYNFMPDQFPESILLELMFTAPHGTTVAYGIEKNGLSKPVYEIQDEALSNYGLVDFQQGAMDTSAGFAKSIPYENACENERLDLIEFYFKNVFDGEDTDVKNYFGDFPFSFVGNSKDIRKFAPRLTKQDLYNIYWIRKYEPIDMFYAGESFYFSCKRMDADDVKTIEEFKKNANSEKQERDRKAFWDGKEHDALPHPFMALSRLHGNIVVYGAGKVGTSVRSYLSEDGSGKNLLWVDKNFEKLRLAGKDVSSVESITEFHPDYIVIAIANRYVAQGLRFQFMCRGYSREQVVLLF